MKLRLEKGTVKFRLTPNEIEELISVRQVSENIYLGKSHEFGYSIRVADQGSRCSLDFNNRKIRVIIPEPLANKWATSSQIGLKEIIVTDRGDTIELIVEEDLPPRKKRNRI